MSELVQTLWFEDTGFLNEQMLDTPLGRFSIRQMGIFVVFGLLAWGTSFISEDMVIKIIVAGMVFCIGVGGFNRKIKTLSPERHLLYIMGKRLRQTNQTPIALKTQSRIPTGGFGIFKKIKKGTARLWAGIKKIRNPKKAPPSNNPGVQTTPQLESTNNALADLEPESSATEPQGTLRGLN
ncbi:MAG: hypothetical protein LBQ98_04990 [Nitrososphaerota archaeon]|nr:hypothetical protein [Nitrososphaerota archaeon]